jgi:predicted ATPase/DNA-binding SARP family transcriptional activator
VLEIRILGPLEVTDGGVKVSVRGKRRVTLLAGLASSPDMVASRDRLVEAVWGDTPPKDPLHALHSLVSQVRQALGDASVIEASGDGYALRRDLVEVDVFRFRRLVADGRRATDAGDPAQASRVLTEAAAMWRGRVLDGVDIPPVLLPEVAELEELRHTAIEDRLQSEIDLGHHGQVIGELKTLTQADPLRERVWGMLMVALYRSGRQSEALRAYQDAREHLGEMVGIEPGPELRDLEEKILVQDSSIAPAALPKTRKHNLPEFWTAFIGRVDELEAITELFDRSRLVTLVGPGGVGKTRMAVEAARRLIADGGEARFVDLTQIERADDVMPAVGVALGLLESNHDEVPYTGLDIEALVTSYAASREPLIVLDNCEQVIDEAARIADLLLSAGSRVRVLATSREGLRVAAEQMWDAPVLTLPGADGPESDDDLGASDAVRLFADRATAASATFELTVDNIGQVASVCQRLEGMALAIELAAAQVRVFGLPEILERLDRQLALLAGGPRSADARHQSLRAAIEWSYRLLTHDEQHMLIGLAVFAGTFDVAAVERLFNDEPADEIFGELVRKSLVVAEAGPGGSRRYRLLESVREFAAAELAATDDALQFSARHAELYLDRAEAAWGQSETMHRREVAERLMLDLANLRVTLAWFREHDSDRLLQLCGALGWFWEFHYLDADAEQWTEHALAATIDEDSPLRARALEAAAAGLRSAGVARRDHAIERGWEAVAMYRRLGDEHGEARTGLWLSRLDLLFEELADRGLSAERICELYMASGPKWGYAKAIFRHAGYLIWVDRGRSFALGGEAADIFLELGDEASWAQVVVWRNFMALMTDAEVDFDDDVARALDTLDMRDDDRLIRPDLLRAALARERFDWEAAERHGRRALEMARDTPDTSMGMTAGYLGWIKHDSGDPAGAAEYFRLAADGYRPHQNFHGQLHIVEALMTVAADSGRYQLGARLHGAARAFRTSLVEGSFSETGYDMHEWDARRYEPSLDRISTNLTDQEFETAVAEGNGWSLDQAIEVATTTMAGARIGR